MEQLLPPLSGEQFSSLENDILENGCYAPIIVNEDMVIIDGHNRVLSLDNPRQRETWEILSQQKNKTNVVCEAVCGYHRQKCLEDTLRKVLREELKNVAIPQTAEAVEEPDTTVDAAVLDFLLAMQNE